MAAGCAEQPAAEVLEGPGDATGADTDAAEDGGVGGADAGPAGEAFVGGIWPSEGPTGGLTAVTLAGRGLAGAIAVRFGETPALDVFPVRDDEVVLLSPPRPAGWVDVHVDLADGTTVTRPRGFLYRDPVAVAAVEPAEGSSLGGTPLTLRGAGFTEGAVVLIGGRRALEVRVREPGLLTCTSPEGVPGAADVLVAGPTGSARLARGFTFLASPAAPADVAVSALSPESGPVAGGTEVTVTGSGLVAGLGVRLGPTPVLGVRVQGDGTRLTFRTPPGSAGPASLHLIAGDRRTSIAAAFTYVAEAPRLFAASPARGAVAGGTRVALLGEGLPTGRSPTVRIGGRAARILAADANRVLVESPPGPVGPADIAVTWPGVDLALPQGFTWYDPATAAGTSGEPLADHLNVTVIAARGGDRLPGVTVLATAAAPATGPGLSCRTDAAGQCVLAAEGLVGPVVVTAAAPGFQTVSLGGVGAEDVTIPLAPAWTCEDASDYPCDMLGSADTSTLRVTVDGLDKGPTPAFGRCADWRDVTAHCTPCTLAGEDATAPDEPGAEPDDGPGCDAGETCQALGLEGSFCSQPCASAADCEGGFLCRDPAGGADPRCVPPPPERVAFCNVSEVDPSEPEGLVWPGAEVDEAGAVTLTGRLGDMAVVCLAGNEVRGTFVPDTLGVRRGLEATAAGEVIAVTVPLEVALDARATVRLDLPSLVRAGDLLASDRAGFDAWLMLGGDGGVPFRSTVGTRTDTWEVAIPSRLTGPLWDATWGVRGVVTSPSRSGGAVVVALNLADLRAPWERRAGPDGAWEVSPAGLPEVYAGAPWGAGGTGAARPDGAVVVGDGGLILRRAGPHWGRMGSGTGARLLAVASATVRDGSGKVTAIATGAGGVATHWDGLRWQPQPTGTREDVTGVAFLPDGVRAVAVAGRSVLGWDGATWRRLWEAPRALHGVAASEGSVGAGGSRPSGAVWVVGAGGLVAVADTEGGAFVVRPSGTTADLQAVALGAGGAVDVVGAGGVWLVGDASGLRALRTPEVGAGLPEDASRLGRNLTVVVAMANVGLEGFPADAVAGGLDGTLWHRRGDVVEAALGAAGSTPAASADLARGAVRALVPLDGGLWALGTHDRVLGPFVGIPEDVRPEDGGLLGAQLSWTGGGLPPHYATVEVAGAIGPCTVCGLQVRIPWTPWLAILRGDLPRADFPAAALLAGSGLGGAGPHTARITRVRLEGDFDFDATAAAGLAGGVRRAWAWRSTSFLKL